MARESGQYMRRPPLATTSESAVAVVFRNGIKILAAKVAGLCISWFVVRVLVTNLGLQGYGLCETLMSLLTISSIGSAVVGGVMLRETSRLVAQKRSCELVESFRRGIGAALLWGCGAGVLLVAFRFRVATLLSVPPADFNEYGQAVAIFGIALPVVAVAEVSLNLLSGIGRSGIASVITIICSVLGGVLGAVLCICGLAVRGFAIGQFVTIVLSACIGCAVSKRYSPELLFCPKILGTTISGRTSRYALFLAFGSIALIARDGIDKLLVARHASADWSAMIGISQRLCIPIVLVCTMIYVPTVACAASLSATNDWHGIRRIHQSTSRFLSLLAGALGVAVYGLHRVAALIWLGRGCPELSATLYWILFGTVFAIILTGTISSILKGAGVIRPELWYILLGLVMNGILKYYWCDVSPIGSLMASAVSWACSSVLFVVLASGIHWISRRLLLESSICGLLFIATISAMSNSQVLSCRIESAPLGSLLGQGVVLACLGVTVYVFGCFATRVIMARCAVAESVRA